MIGSSSRWGDLYCGVFAADALGGPAQPGPGLTEWRYWSWLWWWKQVLAGLVVAGLAAGFYALAPTSRLIHLGFSACPSHPPRSPWASTWT